MMPQLLLRRLIFSTTLLAWVSLASPAGPAVNALHVSSHPDGHQIVQVSHGTSEQASGQEIHHYTEVHLPGRLAGPPVIHEVRPSPRSPPRPRAGSPIRTRASHRLQQSTSPTRGRFSVSRAFTNIQYPYTKHMPSSTPSGQTHIVLPGHRAYEGKQTTTTMNGHVTKASYPLRYNANVVQGHIDVHNGEQKHTIEITRPRRAPGSPSPSLLEAERGLRRSSSAESLSTEYR